VTLRLRRPWRPPLVTCMLPHCRAGHYTLHTPSTAPHQCHPLPLPRCGRHHVP
jgi:hypothetical protein